MYSYIVGKIISLNKKTITFENNFLGYSIFVPDASKFEIGQIKKLYVYKNISMTTKSKIVEEMYGFGSYDEKDFFLQLLNVTGVGPKNAVAICKNDITVLKNIISAKDAEALVTLGITPKIAKAIIDEIKIEFPKESKEYVVYTRVAESLKSLGYEAKDIEFALRTIQINESDDISENIARAIRTIAMRGGENEFNPTSI
ncbi:MAG: hypothetical protein LBC44_01045 [Mycoplasmataceae bacterium]|jgi:Holliday junction DNA helicase RuvA|nr:hypothetical protein [Mycoplasmataceae bacterium]